MKYLGGKARLAKDVTGVLRSLIDESTYCFIDLFCGSCNITSNMGGIDIPRYANDLNPYIVAVYDAIVNQGWTPPTAMDEEEYQHIRANRDIYPIELVGFASFGCSFAGKWWAGFARNNIRKDGTVRNYVKESSESAIRKAKKMEGVKFSTKSYQDCNLPPKKSLIYCDIPYKDTTAYGGVDKFDHSDFYGWLKEHSDKHDIIVSEYAHNVPKGAKIIWSKQSKTGLRGGSDGKKALITQEVLFTFSDLKNSYVIR